MATAVILRHNVVRASVSMASAVLPKKGLRVVQIVTAVRGTVAMASAVPPARSASAMARAPRPVPPLTQLALMAVCVPQTMVQTTAGVSWRVIRFVEATATVLAGCFVLLT